MQYWAEWKTAPHSRDVSLKHGAHKAKKVCTVRACVCVYVCASVQLCSFSVCAKPANNTTFSLWIISCVYAFFAPWVAISFPPPGFLLFQMQISLLRLPHLSPFLPPWSLVIITRSSEYSFGRVGHMKSKQRNFSKWKKKQFDPISWLSDLDEELHSPVKGVNPIHTAKTDRICQMTSSLTQKISALCNII